MADDPFENMLAQMDRAEEYADVDHGIFERLKHPERTLKVTLPVELDSGEVEVFEGIAASSTALADLLKAASDSTRRSHSAKSRRSPGG